MQTKRFPEGRLPSGEAAFTLIELVVAISVLMIVFVTIFASMTMGLSITQISRENLRATQIMLDKMEGLRLYSWDQLNNSSFLQSAFTNSFFETNDIGMVTASGTGVQYTGAVVVAAVPISPTYSNHLRQVTVTVGWISGNVSRTRSMVTYAGEQGLQNYIYRD